MPTCILSPEDDKMAVLWSLFLICWQGRRKSVAKGLTGLTVENRGYTEAATRVREGSLEEVISQPSLEGRVREGAF